MEHECHACNNCGKHLPTGRGLVGFRLVFSAFMVFVLPLILAVIGGMWVQIHEKSVILTILAAFVSWAVGVIFARLVTRRIKGLV